MSKGTQVLPFRIPAELLVEMQITIARRNNYTAEEAWSTSDFIRLAIADKIRKMARSRRNNPSARRVRRQLKKKG